jgi:hypothetical protein
MWICVKKHFSGNPTYQEFSACFLVAGKARRHSATDFCWVKSSVREFFVATIAFAVSSLQPVRRQ